MSREREGIRIDLPCRMTINYGLNRVRFPGPVPVGQRIRLRTKLLEVETINPGKGPDGQPQALQLMYQQAMEVAGSGAARDGCGDADAHLLLVSG